jgi:hypothetical protein
MVPKSSTPLDVNMMKGGNCKLLLFDVQCDDSGSNFYFSFAEKKEDFHWSLFTWCGVLCSGILCVWSAVCVCVLLVSGLALVWPWLCSPFSLQVRQEGRIILLGCGKQGR